MKEMFVSLGNFWERYIANPIVHFRLADMVDILILTAIIYGLYMFIKNRRAGKLALGFFFVIVLYVISDLIELRAIHQVMEAIAPFSIILLAIVFQPELRDFLEKLGSTPFGWHKLNTAEKQDASLTISAVVEAACEIAQREKDGALIVIERTTPLGDYADRGDKVNAAVSSKLLQNIFVDRSPLHDGAVIIRKNRIAAAGCKLPASTNEEVIRDLGTRHRAAVGISEVSDCVVVVVSEERHRISVASNGRLKRDYHMDNRDFLDDKTKKNIQNALQKDLYKLLLAESPDERERNADRKKLWSRITFSWGIDFHAIKESFKRAVAVLRNKDGEDKKEADGKASESKTADAKTGKMTYVARKFPKSADVADSGEEADTARVADAVHAAETADGTVAADQISAGDTPADRVDAMAVDTFSAAGTAVDAPMAGEPTEGPSVTDISSTGL